MSTFLDSPAFQLPLAMPTAAYHKQFKRFTITAPPEHYCMLAIKKGNGMYRILSTIEDYLQNDFIIIKPGQSAVIVPDVLESVEFCFFFFRDDMVLPMNIDFSAHSLISQLLTPQPPLIKFILTEEQFITIEAYHTLFSEQESTALPYSNLIRCHNLTAMLITLARIFSASAPASDNAAPQSEQLSLTIEKVKYKIKKNYTEPLPLSSLAEYVQFNPSYLSRIFREFTGVTISGYINQIRIEHARQLLLDTDDLILDIAFSCGFPCISNFNLVFKNLTGTSPVQFRKMHRKVHL